MSKKSKMERRVQATQATLDRFNNRPFSMEDGVDCGQLILFHVRKLGVKVPKHKLQKYKTPSQARAAIREAYGVTTLAALCDKFFDRIPVAAALVGDIIELPSAPDQPEHSLGALSIYLDNQSVLLFEQDSATLVSGRLTFDPEAPPLAAWRVIK